MDDEQILKKIHYERNHSKKTIANYKFSVNQYKEYSGKTLADLIEMAQKEERERVPWIDRKLKDELIGFRAYLHNKYDSERTANEYFMNIQAILRHNFVEIHYLPPISTKRSRKPHPISYKDLPDKPLLQTIFRLSNPVMKAINTHMVSCGMSKVDCLNLTVENHIDSLKDYNIPKGDTIYETLQNIQKRLEDEPLVGTYYHHRQKTGIQFYTFVSPESVKATNEYLLTRPDLKLDDPLFKISGVWLSMNFQKMNDELHLGKVGKYNRYTSKMLRRYHATHLKKGMDRDKVDFLQGRQVLSSTQQAYYFENYEELKQEYLQNMQLVMIDYECEIVEIDTPEVQEIKKENEKLKAEREEFLEKSKVENKNMVLSILRDYGLEVK